MKPVGGEPHPELLNTLGQILKETRSLNEKMASIQFWVNIIGIPFFISLCVAIFWFGVALTSGTR